MVNHTLISPPTIMLDNLTISYQRHPVVHHLSGQFLPGQSTAIVGPNGAGKTSLLRALVGLNRLYQGRITGINPQKIAYLPQQTELDKTFPLTVLDVIGFGDWQRSGWFGSVKPKHRQAGLVALGTVGLQGFEHRYIDELSVGQMQRVLFARLLVQDAPVIVLDEPFAALDAKTTHDLLEVIHQWQQQGRTVIAVLHDLQQVKEHFPHTLLLAKECIAWGNTSWVLTEDHLYQANHIALHTHAHAPICHVDDTVPH